MQKNWLLINQRVLVIVLVLVFAAALGIRLFDLDDLPLDFGATRQLFSMFKARGMYYAMNESLPEWQREMAVQQWQDSPVIEPPVLEGLVAVSYLVFGENLAIARIYSSLFWLAGGLFLFLLARKMSNDDSALIVLLLYLFLPYGIFASRSFQPDPLMTGLMIASAWGLWQWREAATWRWAITAGLLMGLTIFVKNVMVFPLAFAALALVIQRGIKESLSDKQVWAVAGLSVLPAGLFTIYGLYIAGFLGQQFAFRFFPELLMEPSFYLRWKEQWDYVFGFGTVATAVIGLLLLRGRSLALLLGLWLGYIAYGLTFAYHIVTHSYYHLPFIPMVALGLAPVAHAIFLKLAELSWARLTRALAAGFLILVVFLQVWAVRVELLRLDFRDEPAYWLALGDVLGHSNTPVLIIAQDYGGRLAYWGWQPVQSWYTDGDIAVRELAGIELDLPERFKKMAEGKRFFVAARLSRFDDDKALKNMLYENYPVYAEGQGYIIFDLQAEKIP